MQEESRKKRIGVYLEEPQYSELRSKLIIKKITVSEWLRNIIKEFLKK